MTDVSVDYGLLLEQFLDGAMSAEEFQSTYLDRFKNERRRLEDASFDLLDRLFGDVDSFSTDPKLLAENPGFYLDERQLREKTRAAAVCLAALKK